MKILVTGGAGYIGSHVVKQLVEAKKHKITIVDNLSTGSMSSIETLKKLDNSIDFVKQDLSDWELTGKLLQNGSFDAVMHFAASLIVPESIENPLKYYINNTANTANLVRCCLEHGVKKFIFSSTAAVYGEPDNADCTPVNETYSVEPINPYGKSKLFCEEIIKDAASADKEFKYVILRYFNVAGADKDGLLGQSMKDATHLLKIAAQTALNRRDKMSIFGGDYNTPDGTCIRDYIHVDDLASAHICSLDYLEDGESRIFNCGYGHGFSVKEAIEIMREVSGNNFTADMTERRAGDPACLVADSTLIRKCTGWEPQYDNLSSICKSTLEWEKNL